MKASGLHVCPGCGLTAAETEAEAETGPNERYRASNACWQLYVQMSGEDLERQDLAFTHQASVDAYGAQHAGGASKPITVAFSLIGLYLALEHGYNGRQVQQAHMKLARLRIAWPRLEPPAGPWDMTVADVFRAEPGEAREARRREWAAAVWRGWAGSRDWVREQCARYLDVR